MTINKRIWWVGGLIALVVILVVLHRLNVFPDSWGWRGDKNYEAVFLSNGQVYFGHLSQEGRQYVVLRDIYYLQVNTPPQPAKAGETQPTNINLVKLGSELHGPEDEMRINRDQILFVEDLRADSRVVEAIGQFKTANQ
ncbi:MAG: hypothetical protein AAB617_01650, partial [Patescibacteria group bacterium]